MAKNPEFDIFVIKLILTEFIFCGNMVAKPSQLFQQVAPWYCLLIYDFAFK